MGDWQFNYRIADCEIVLRGTDIGLEALAASVYEGVRCEKTSARAQVFELEDRAKGLVLKSAGVEVGVARTLNELFQLVEWQLTEIFMRGLGAFFQLHAAVAVCGDRALVMCGPSEAGKTSLLIGLATSGARAYTDEIALIASDDLRIHPFPRDLIVHSGTQSMFPEILFEQPTWKDFCSYRFVSAVVF